MSRDNTKVAADAVRVLLDGRDPFDPDQRADILVTLDHVIATALLMVMDGNGRNAAIMFNEGTVPHVESRLALYENKDKP